MIRGAALGAVVGAVVVGVVAAACGSDSRLERADDLLTDGDRFTTGTESALTFGRVTSIVRADADDCAEDNRADDPRCAARFEASAWLQITALTLDTCTRPHRDDARDAARTYLAKVARTPAGGPRPEPPEPITC